MADRYRRPTIAEVAAVAQVSMMTVSRVLNGHRGVATETHQRVERAIAETGFVRNRAARAMKQGRAGIVHLVIPNLDSAYILEIMRGVEETVGPGPYQLAVSTTHHDPQAEGQVLAQIADSGSDGAILVLARGQSAPLTHLRHQGVPYVVVDHRGDLGADTPAVGATNWSGSYQATNYLLALSHQRIACISGPRALGCSRARLSGYRAGLEAAQVPTDAALICEADFDLEGGYAAAQTLLDRPLPPTAIITGSDMQAVGVYAAARERNLSIPGDLSVIGFDDIPLATLISPSLTTVRQPLAEMGRVAASMLLTLIDGTPLTSPRVELATALIVRASCAGPAITPPTRAVSTAAGPDRSIDGCGKGG